MLTSLLFPAPQLSLLALRTGLAILLALVTAQPILAHHRVFRPALSTTRLGQAHTVYKARTVWSYQAPDIVQADPFYRQVTGEAAAMGGAEEGVEEQESEHEVIGHLMVG